MIPSPADKLGFRNIFAVLSAKDPAVRQLASLQADCSSPRS